jgi:anti-sigma factor RsiW
MPRAFLLLMAAVLAAGPAVAAELATEAKAIAAAVKILKGDPYGSTDAEVRANIREVVRTTRSATACGGGAAPVWSIRVVVAAPNGDADSPIDGRLVLDAKSGRMVCAGLPFLD